MIKPLVFLAAFSTAANAMDINFGIGSIVHPSVNSALVRIEGRSALPDDWLKPISENLSSYWQLNGNLWHDSHYAVGAGLGVQYHLNDNWSLELAWGGILLNDRMIQPNYDMGSEFHFETSLGVQYRWSRTSALRVNYSHWSNANMANINPGCEILSLRYQHSF